MVKDKYLKKIIKIEKRHFKKYKYRRMIVEELKELFELKT